MNGKPEPVDIGFQPEAKRLTDEELKKQESAIDPADPSSDSAPKSYWDEEAGLAEDAREADRDLKFFAAEGIALLVEPSPIAEDVRIGGFYDRAWRPAFPGFVIAREHYGRIVRMLDRKQPVKVAFTLAARFGRERRRLQRRRRNRRHRSGSASGDRDAGRPPRLVARGNRRDRQRRRMRRRDGSGPHPARRSAPPPPDHPPRALDRRRAGLLRIRSATSRSTSAIRKRSTLQPEHAKLSVYFNLDNGSGRIRGVNLQGNEAVRTIFDAWLRPFNYIGAATLTTLNTGGTDHMPFDAVGLPGFQFIQDPLNYDTKAHHSSLDVFEEAIPDDLKQASVILASFVYHAAMRDAMLPRKPLPAPHKETK